ncbi:MAG: SGNH/GDSL hydrolase family protein [Prevotellaceae bacterium]|jgi:lysophospholipase L1-like esterase|nr:SGNH/GDSL hydrolase family protein [Prevotellaceae bacterium]
MKKRIRPLPSVLLSVAGLLWALPAGGQMTYYNADAFPLFGKVSAQTETRYERLPAALRDVSRQPVWELGKNTAGLYLRFRTNSTAIELKWTLYKNRIMSHMAFVGVKGFDLYCYENGEWRFVNAAQPNNAMDNAATLIDHMDDSEKEMMLYFPLYDGITSLQIGIDSTATIAPPQKAVPADDRPVVCYGTSILQGGCASRPGMAHTNILARRFNRTFINLGFSGHAQLDYEIAELIAGSNASLIILDFVPNASVEQMQEKMERFYTIIRAKHPDTPILFIEDPPFPKGRYNRSLRQEVDAKNATFRLLFERLKSHDDHIDLIASEPMIGDDNEATVDGIHFTDLGFMRYADYLYPILKPYIDN